jgi:hypothetical protein
MSVKAFITANSTAFAAASKVFAQIESQSDAWADALASAGIVGPDIRVFAVAYVTEKSGVQPHPSRKGGALTFKKDSKEDNRVKYLVAVATGAAAAKAAKRGSGKTDPVAALLSSYAKLTPAQKRSFKAQL